MRPKFFSSLNVTGGKSTRSVRNLILKQRWECLRQYISTEVGQHEVLNFGGSSGADRGETALHLACNFDPPLDIVHEILALYPNAVSMVDRSGKTPLHVVAPVFESAQLLICILERWPTAAAMVDKEGKTPLILLCEHAGLDVEKDPFILAGYEKAGIEMYDAAVALCNAAPPSMVCAEDSSGCNALEYAILNNVDNELVTFLMERLDQATGTHPVMKSKEDCAQKLIVTNRIDMPVPHRVQKNEVQIPRAA